MRLDSCLARGHSAGRKLGREARLEVDPEGFGLGGERTLQVRERG